MLLESEKVETCEEISKLNMAHDSTLAPAQDLTTTVKVSAFRVRSLRYIQVLIRIFSM